MNDSSSHEKRIRELHTAADDQYLNDHDKKFFLGSRKDVDVLMEENAEVIRCAREGNNGPYVLELRHQGRRYIHNSMSPILIRVS